MSNRVPIPRPRHLFPEIAAVLIEGGRTQLRISRGVRRAIGRIPLWIGGSLAGVAGVMLAISLFFVRDPEVRAALATDPQITPTVSTPFRTPQIEPTSFATPSFGAAGRPLLTARWERMRLPDGWDPDRVVTVVSAPRIQSLEKMWSLNDHWQRALPGARISPAFVAYVSQSPSRLDHARTLFSADAVPQVLPPVSLRRMGLVVEKVTVSHSEWGQPLTYDIVVRNSSLFEIEELSVRERVSQLQRVSLVTPPASVIGDELVWSLKGLAPGAVQRLSVTLVPSGGGEIRTETRVFPVTRVGAAVHVRTAPEKSPQLPIPAVRAAPGAPNLKLSYTPVEGLQQGETLSVIFSVTNVGTATAEDVKLFVRLSGQFEHRYGEFVKHYISRLEPGETRRALLQATARDSGDGQLAASLTMQGTEAESRALKIPIRSGSRQISETPAPADARWRPVQNVPLAAASEQRIVLAD